MTTRTKVLLVILALSVSFATGRYSVQAPKVKTTEVVHTDTQENKTKDTQTHTVVVTTKTPDGTVKTVQTTDTNTIAATKETQVSDIKFQQTITPPKSNTLNIAVLAGNDFSKGILEPTYGLSVSKQLIGPVTAGVWGLRSGTVGVSVGLNF